MALTITGIFIQFLGLALQIIQLRRGRLDDPWARVSVPDAGWTASGQGRRGEAAAADGDEASEHARQGITRTPSLGHGGTARARLELKAKTPQTTDRSSPAAPMQSRVSRHYDPSVAARGKPTPPTRATSR